MDLTLCGPRVHSSLPALRLSRVHHVTDLSSGRCLSMLPPCNVFRSIKAEAYLGAAWSICGETKRSAVRVSFNSIPL